MLRRRRVIPPRLVALWELPPRMVEALVRKESLDCGSCGAKLRARRLARVLLDLYPIDGEAPARSIRDWVMAPSTRSLHIAEVNLVDGLHAQLSRLPGLSYSEYQEAVATGSCVAGVRCEDLTCLTFPDGAFDLIVTSETLEHVADLEAALRELWRVLRPGGRHVFTVPVRPDVPHTFPRSILHPDGTVEHLSPPIRHPGGDAGYPVFTEFGLDLPDLLRAHGWEVEVRFGPTTEEDLAQVFIMSRPAQAESDGAVRGSCPAGPPEPSRTEP